jgi:hypothetical protein
LQAADAEWEPAIGLVYPHFFFKGPASFNPTNKNLTDLGLEIQTALNLVTLQNSTHILLKFFYNDQDCPFPKYWPLLLNHPVYSSRKTFVFLENLAKLSSEGITSW